MQANGIKTAVNVHAMALSNQEENTAALQVQAQHATGGGGLSTLASNASRLAAQGTKMTQLLVKVRKPEDNNQCPPLMLLVLSSYKVSTLDAWDKTRTSRGDTPSLVDIIKIDVEGFELFVLQGGRSVIARDKPTLLIEREGNNMAQAGVTDEALDKVPTNPIMIKPPPFKSSSC